jgi:hypothetical protein
MKTIIAGSRTITDYELVKAAIIASQFNITEVVSGTARGVDSLGERWAEENKIPIKQFKPDWNTLGKSAGYKRNAEMVEYANALVAIWDGVSKGTAHTIGLARIKGLQIYVHKA